MQNANVEEREEVSGSRIGSGERAYACLWGRYPGFRVPHSLPLPADPRAASNCHGAHHQELGCSAELERELPAHRRNYYLCS